MDVTSAWGGLNRTKSSTNSQDPSEKIERPRRASKIKNIDADDTIMSTSHPDRIVTDEKGNYIFCQGEVIMSRYQVRLTAPIGSGAFGVVVEALDLRTNRVVAVKFIKARQKFQVQAEQEIRILEQIRSLPPEAQSSGHVVEFIHNFRWEEHECLVFERLSISLYDFLSLQGFKGVPLYNVRVIGRQLLESLRFLKQASIIHCDLKPENVLFLEPRRKGRVKLIDFGCSCMSYRQLHKYIQSRWYRAPEVLLGIPYDFKVDMWSVGCILAELHMGTPLFPGGHKPLTQRSPSHDMLLRFVRILGPLPPEMVESSMKVTGTRAVWGSGTSSKRTSINMRDELFRFELDRYASKQTPVAELGALLRQRGWAEREQQFEGERWHTTGHYELFIDFLLSILRLDPQDRADPEVALSHPFLDDRIWSDVNNVANGRTGSALGSNVVSP